MQQKSVKIEVRCNSNGFLVLKGSTCGEGGCYIT